MKHYYTLHYKKPRGEGEGVIFTNLAKLSRFIKGEDDSDWKPFKYKLEEHFSRKKKQWFEDPYENISIIKCFSLIKGDQRVTPRAKKSHSTNFQKK